MIFVTALVILFCVQFRKNFVAAFLKFYLNVVVFIDICDEDLGECHWETRPGCDKCYYRGDPCIASCDGRECGTDGCTSNCGACADGLACKEGFENIFSFVILYLFSLI